jgi:hypothetical protein
MVLTSGSAMHLSSMSKVFDAEQGDGHVRGVGRCDGCVGVILLVEDVEHSSVEEVEIVWEWR